jgi:hypothetical protein
MRTILLNSTVYSFLLSQNILAQQKTVTGIVSDASANQLIPVLKMAVNYPIQGISIDVIALFHYLSPRERTSFSHRSDILLWCWPSVSQIKLTLNFFPDSVIKWSIFHRIVLLIKLLTKILNSCMYQGN